MLPPRGCLRAFFRGREAGRRARHLPDFSALAQCFNAARNVLCPALLFSRCAPLPLPICDGRRTSALAKLSQRVAARGAGAGMGGAGHANNPTFMFQVLTATGAKLITTSLSVLRCAAPRGRALRLLSPTRAVPRPVLYAGRLGQEQVEGRHLRLHRRHHRRLRPVVLRLVCAAQGRRVVERCAPRGGPQARRGK